MGVGPIETTPLERMTAAAVIAIGSWIGINWILALTHTLTRTTLSIALALFVIAAIVLLWKYLRLPAPDPFALLVCIPIVVWIAFVLWRGALLPPDNHDALAYHLPKAVFIAENHGYGYFVTGDPRVTVLPANYELLLTDILVLTGTDHITEWIGTAFYILFLIACGAAVERWFGRGPAAAATIVATAATPVLLLHSGADKNDLMTCFFCVAALMWGARWCVDGGRMPWVLTIVSMVLAGGTKPHAAAVLVGLAPFFAARAIRHRPTLRNFAYTVLFSIAAFTIGGGAVYAVNFSHARDKAAAIGTTPNFIGYGDWANWWRFPYMLLAEPFSREPLGVYVPWRHQWWFWPRYELFFSGYGPLFTILICLIPYCVYRFRDRMEERFVFAIAAAIAAFLTMPLQFRPLGFFGGLPRFVAFVVPAVMGYSIAPIVAHVSLRTARVIMAALAIYFSYEAFQCGYRDRFSPWIYVERAMHEHVRWVWISPWRAGNALDRMAGPRDTVAVDCAFDTWIYLAMGEYHSRHLEFIKAGAVQIPPDAEWVMVDRTWNLIWRDPRLTDMSQAFAAMFAGRPTMEDTRVIRALWNDRHWKLVYYRPRLNQAIFRRQ
ncbi:MAG TPA: hypothetical protein VL284_17800 [Thermoanaerobaculia bacterium]|nr:hypothetical protein [Thermoanaerobaculia bacterium]